MLDDTNVIQQRDPTDMLGSVSEILNQMVWQPAIASPDSDGRTIDTIVIAGMGGSALAPSMLRQLAQHQLTVPYEVVNDYNLPHYTSESTLVITMSHSGNTEETVSCYHQARRAGAQLAVITGGGSLEELASQDDVARVIVPVDAQPRLSVIYHMRALAYLLHHFEIMSLEIFDGLAEHTNWLAEHIDHWHTEVPVHDNYAKQLSLLAVGKTPVIYAGPLLAPLAYKWKISWNENAKNVAFMNQYPEFNHNEFVGWSSHPVEKPFVIFDLASSFESERIDERMRLSDQLLSGLRPKAVTVTTEGDSLLAQYLWGIALADMVSIYVAILNGVKPEPVELVEKLKQTLS